MTPRQATILSRAIWVLAIAMFFLAIAMSLVFPLPGLPASRLVPDALRAHTGGPAGAASRLVFSAFGALILARQPRNRIGWILGAVAVLLNLEFAGLNSYAAFGLYVQPGALPGAIWALWVTEWLRFPTLLVLAGFLPILFPDGHFISSRWRVVALVAGLGAVLSAIGVAIAPDALAAYRLENPFTLAQSAALARLLQPVSLLIIIGCFVAGVVSIAVRYRSADSVRRQQLKWFVSALTVLVLFFACTTVFRVVTGVDIAASIVPVGILLVGSSIGIAVLKYRLYAIDIVISRTVLFVAMAAFISAVYVVLVVGIGSLVGKSGGTNVFLSVTATALVAIAFEPVRRRAQRLANRLAYGNRAAPYDVLSGFSKRLADDAGGELLPRTARILAEGTGASKVVVWLRVGSDLVPTAVWPADAIPPDSVTIDGQVPPLLGGDHIAFVVHQGEMLGAMSVYKKPGDVLRPIEAKLTDDLADQAGLLLRNLRLGADLERRRALERFLPKEAVDRVLRGDDLRASGERRVVTVLFADLRDSTALSESMTGPQVVSFLNTFVGAMAQAVFDNGGMIDKLLGDGLMAVFGVVPNPTMGAEAAVKTALDIRGRMLLLNRRRQAEDLPAVRYGIGIHTGAVVLGAVGISERSDYTAVGDTVNTASRLETLTKNYADRPVAAVISEETAQRLPAGVCKVESLGTVEIRGKTGALSIYRLD
jgi:class 3 adenylate cyclase